MFGIKKAGAQAATKEKVEKLKGPKQISELVVNYLESSYNLSLELARGLKVVEHGSSKGEKARDCRIYDDAEAEASVIKIKDYNTLDAHPELVLYEGWFDEITRSVELVEKRRISDDIPLFTEAEIMQKVEALSEPGSTVFFYQARGPAVGGPLGRGAVVVELTPHQSGKKGKKYTIYTTNVVGTEFVGNRNKLYSSDKPKEIAQWIMEGHHKRISFV